MKGGWRSLIPDAGLILLVTMVAYLPAVQNGFVVDDVLITKNPLIGADDGLYRFWFTTEAPDYYPVTWSLWWLQWRLWGDDPTGFHAVNVTLHAVNAILVLLVLRRLMIPGAAVAALLFALHPVNVATVAWISEQKNTVSFALAASSLLLYLSFDEENRYRWYGLSLAGFLFALLSKTAVVMLPVVLLGCVWWRRQKVGWTDLLRTAPFFALSLVLGLVTLWFQHQHVLSKIPARTEGFVERLLTAGWAIWFYLSKAVWPVNLTLIYPKWDSDPGRWVSYMPVTLLMACFAMIWWKRNTWGRPLLFGLGYYVVMLLPVLGFFDQGFYYHTLVADHWQYYSIVGVIALAMGAEQKFCRPRQAGRAVTAAVLVVLGGATWMRAHVYRSNATISRDNIAKNPAASMAHYNLGLALWHAGQSEEAMTHFREALRHKPNYLDARVNLGVALAASGDLDAAMAEFREALRIHPNNAGAHNNLGLALAKRGHLEEAIAEYEHALRLQPDYPTAHENLARALMESGKIQEAIAHYEQILRLQPDYPDAYANLLLAREALKKKAAK